MAGDESVEERVDGAGVEHPAMVQHDCVGQLQSGHVDRRTRAPPTGMKPTMAKSRQTSRAKCRPKSRRFLRRNGGNIVWVERSDMARPGPVRWTGPGGGL